MKKKEVEPRVVKAVTTSHQQTDAQPLSKWWLSWKDSPPALLLNIVLYSMEYLLGQSGSAVPAVSLPISCLLQTACTGVDCETEKALTLCEHHWAVAKEWCVTNTGYVTNHSYSLIQDARKKNNSTPARPSILLDNNRAITGAEFRLWKQVVRLFTALL